MEKHDILRRAQASKHDEGAQYFHQKAKAIAGAIFTFLCSGPDDLQYHI